MKYKLQFIKISPEHKFAGVGFAGNIFITLNALMHIGKEDKLVVDMETNECACTEKDLILHNTKNCWEYYFDQSSFMREPDVTTFNSLLPARINYNNREEFLDPKNYIELKDRFFNSFSIKEDIKKEIEEYYLNNIKNKKTLGVQVRLTDMKHYHSVAPVDLYVNKIKEILLNEPDFQQIFLATDDALAIQHIKKNINMPIITHENMFRATSDNPHLHPYDRFEDTRPLHRYKLGVECMKEIFTLAKCDALLKADVSSISIVACILSENIKKVYKL